MNDPHVEKLHYKVVPGEDADYKAAPVLEEETDNFVMTLDGKTAVFVMNKHFATEQEAREVIEDYLSKWAVLIGLEHGPDELNLVFEKSDIIDRSPAPKKNGDVTIQCKSAIMAVSALKATLHISHAEYPSLPRNFSRSVDVETMYIRYKAYRQGREPLTTTANVCRTLLEASAGNRRKAASKYNIGIKVLSKLGLLCDRGSIEEARKAPKKGPFVPLTSEEKEWIEQVVKAIIRRVGEWADFRPIP
jgi:hypothetical protein